MSNSAFVLVNGNLTFDPSRPYISGDVSYETMPAPVPTPKTPTSGTGGSGGGGFISGMPLAPLVPAEIGGWDDALGRSVIRLRYRPGQAAEFARSIARKISDGIQREAGIGSADPLSVPKRLSPDKVREADLRKLRNRIQQLEAEAARATAANTADAEALRATVEELRRLVADLQAQVEALRTPRITLARRPTVEERVAESVEAAVNPGALIQGAALEDALAARILSATLAAATEPDRIRTKLAPDPMDGLWKLIGAAGIAWISSRIERPEWARTTGYGIAAAVGLSGARDLLGINGRERSE
jgi:polyhydroxyalkanoate synthesis regulator phasin